MHTLDYACAALSVQKLVKSLAGRGQRNLAGRLNPTGCPQQKQASASYLIDSNAADPSQAPTGCGVRMKHAASMGAH